ncbi:MAG: neutral/alkaline non-lysosomal ceramidase N-terminal domain-containing protein [Tuberibacillus sp.]
MSINCGAAKVSITPEGSKMLSGYAAHRPSAGIHDHLYARIIVLNEDGNYFIIVSLDLIGVDKIYTHQLRDKIGRKFNISPDAVFVHATHTHSGVGGVIPESQPIWKAFPILWAPYDPELVEEQHESILQGVEKALSHLEPCQVRWGQTEVHGMAANRISETRDFDPRLHVIEFSEIEADKKVILYHFPCHPTILHADNLWISADFPGVVSQRLENRDDVEVAAFLNGPCGDISTRFTRKASNFEEVERMGNILAESVETVLEDTKPLEVGKLKCATASITLEFKEMENADLQKEKLAVLKCQLLEAEKEKADPTFLRSIEAKMEGVESSIGLTAALKGYSEIETEIQVLRIGELSLVSVPGEMFHETGLRVSQLLKGQKILLVGNTNDYIGYIVPGHFYSEESYEVSMTLLKEGSAEKIQDQIIQLLEGEA